MARNTTIQVRIDSDIKASAEALFNHLGLDTPFFDRSYVPVTLVSLVVARFFYYIFIFF